MELCINGTSRRFSEAPPETLADLMTTLEITETRGVAVAINDQVIPRRRWSEQPLQPGDRVEIIRATQGG